MYLYDLDGWKKRNSFLITTALTTSGTKRHLHSNQDRLIERLSLKKELQQKHQQKRKNIAGLSKKLMEQTKKAKLFKRQADTYKKISLLTQKELYQYEINMLKQVQRDRILRQNTKIQKSANNYGKTFTRFKKFKNWQRRVDSRQKNRKNNKQLIEESRRRVIQQNNLKVKKQRQLIQVIRNKNRMLKKMQELQQTNRKCDRIILQLGQYSQRQQQLKKAKQIYKQIANRYWQNISKQ